MRIVTRETVARCLIVHMAALATFHLAVTSQAKLGGSGGKQLDARDVFGDAHFMAAQAVLFGRRMGVLVLGLILVAPNAGGCGDVRIKRSRVLLRDSQSRH